ncbi:MAG: lamin tail domain-containing protein [Candidatus Moranbacteria bacterium]|nr:lamin tail domain-containing protein [Candidatus Moranbacteria bacterium]
MKNKNTKVNLFLFSILLTAGFFGFSQPILAKNFNQLIISEVLIGTNSANEEFIELFNPTDDDINLQTLPLKLHIVNSAGTDTNKTLSFKNSIIEAGNYYLISSVDYYEKYKQETTIGTVYSASLVSNGAVYISTSATKNVDVIDLICWGNSQKCSYNLSNPIKNYSIERMENSYNWQESYDPGGTPGKKASKPKVYTEKISINEIYPHPNDPLTQDEFVELYNSSDKLEKLTNWRIEDRAGKKCDLSGKEISGNGFLLIGKGNTNCELALNDTSGEILKLYNPQDKIPVSSVEYKGSAKEGVSYNFDGASWRWSRFLTPGEENKFNQLPDSKSKNDKKIYVGVYAEFSAKAKDKDKDKLKYTWDFGDGHKSYKKETKHKYEKAGKYKVTLKIFDGSEEKIETFKIKVKKFPRDKVKIKSICPNPVGNDSKNEWVSVKNYSDDEINLKSWSIATGSKKLYNHWIKDDFSISPGEERIITRKYVSFALNNEKGKVELRYPDGKKAYQVKYDKDGKKAEENEVYKKMESGWQWIKSPKNIKTEEQENVETETQENEVIEEEDFEEFMDGQSEDLSGEEKQNELFNYGTNIKLASYVQGNQGRVLGAKTVRSEENIYTFTSPILEEEHYAVKFFKNLGTEINFFINKAILLISSW